MLYWIALDLLFASFQDPVILSRAKMEEFVQTKATRFRVNAEIITLGEHVRKVSWLTWEKAFAGRHVQIVSEITTKHLFIVKRLIFLSLLQNHLILATVILALTRVFVRWLETDFLANVHHYSAAQNANTNKVRYYLYTGCVCKKVIEIWHRVLTRLQYLI